MSNEKKTTKARLYTSEEVLHKLHEIHSGMVVETTKEEDSDMAMVELIVGAKIIGKLREAIDKGEF